MPDDAPTGRPALLLPHLDSLYRLAQALTATPEAARRLVEATCVQALAQLPPAVDEATLRQDLLRLLTAIHHEQQAFAPSETPPPVPGAVVIDRLRRRRAEEAVERTLPLAFAALPHGHQLALLLCEVEGFEPGTAAEILGAPPDEVRRRWMEARATLEAAVREGTTPDEHALIDGYLPGVWLTEAVRDTVHEAFEMAPPTLHNAVVRPSVRPAPGVPAAASPPAPEAAVPAPPRLALPAPSDDGPSPATTAGRILRRAALVSVLIVTIGLGGYLISQALDQPPETNLVMLAARQAEDVRPALLTDEPEAAERYVREQLGWRLTLPTIDQARLTGVGLHEVAPGITVPVFLYEDTLGAEPHPLALYLYNYALLDRYREQVRLAPDVLSQIQDDGRFDLYDLNDRRQVLIWRYRDDIFLAVISAGAEQLRERIVFPS